MREWQANLSGEGAEVVRNATSISPTVFKINTHITPASPAKAPNNRAQRQPHRTAPESPTAMQPWSIATRPNLAATDRKHCALTSTKVATQFYQKRTPLGEIFSIGPSRLPGDNGCLIYSACISKRNGNSRSRVRSMNLAQPAIRTTMQPNCIPNTVLPAPLGHRSPQ